MRAQREPLDLRGTRISEDGLEKIFTSRTVQDDKYVWRSVDLSYAEIEAETADFEHTRFDDRAMFLATTFSGGVDFSFSEFRSRAYLDCEVSGLFRISGSEFHHNVSICTGSCGGEFQAEGIESEGLVLMDGFSVGSDLTFSRSQFKGQVVLYNVSVNGHANFNGTTWSDTTDERYSLEAEQWLILDEAEFRRQAHWNATAEVISCVGTVFRDSIRISSVGSQLLLDRAIFEGPARVVGEVAEDPARSAGLIRSHLLDSVREVDEALVPDGDDGRSPGQRDDGFTMLPRIAEMRVAREAKALEEADQPTLISARRAGLGRVVLTDVDATNCRFFDASEMDRLRWTNLRLGGTPRWRTGRRVIAEETNWRLARRFSWGWDAESPVCPEWLRDPGQRPIGTADLEPEEAPRAELIAEVYRQLRKGREDAGDRPGAADFYYGEMEMRRQAAKRLSGERALLWLYWAVSGYGLRASRAVLTLALAIVLASYAMASSGYCDPADPYGDRDAKVCVNPVDPPAPGVADVFTLSNLSFTAGTAVTVVGAPGAALTSGGHAIRVFLRLIGPLLIALAVLALRNRVRR